MACPPHGLHGEGWGSLEVAPCPLPGADASGLLAMLRWFSDRDFLVLFALSLLGVIVGLSAMAGLALHVMR